MHRSHAAACFESSACCTYPSTFTPFVIIWIALDCSGCELERGGRSGDHLSPSILGTVLPQWAGLIGMQRGLCLSLPRAFSPCLSFCSAWNRHSDENQRAAKVFMKAGHMQENTRSHTLHVWLLCGIEFANTRTQVSGGFTSNAVI